MPNSTIKPKISEGKIGGMVDNLEYSNFENFKTPNRSLCWEISSPLSAYSHCRSDGVGCGGVGGGVCVEGRMMLGDAMTPF